MVNGHTGKYRAMTNQIIAETGFGGEQEKLPIVKLKY